MYDNRVYWIFIQQTLGYGSDKIKPILEKFETSEKFFKAGYENWKKSRLFSEKELHRLSNFNFKLAENLITYCNKRKYDIITFEDERYPFRLKNIYNPPAVLFVKGKLPDVDNIVTISIVGTRSATEYGKKVAYYFGKSLAELGIIIVSGGALGIDSTAQRGALMSSGKVISVLGCGLDSDYLRSKAKLRNSIANSGALITEYLPSCSPLPGNFPLRNRIISGLSLGTIVVEAGIKSGALITAKLAMEQNRDVFAVPGNITNRSSKGTNNILKSWAKPVTCVEDVLEEYHSICPKFDIIKSTKKHYKNLKTKNNKLPSNISQTAELLYNNLTEVPVHIDVLVSKIKVDVQSFLQAVTELELYNLIKVKPGRKYSKP